MSLSLTRLFHETPRRVVDAVADHRDFSFTLAGTTITGGALLMPSPIIATVRSWSCGSLRQDETASAKDAGPTAFSPRGAYASRLSQRLARVFCGPGAR